MQFKMLPGGEVLTGRGYEDIVRAMADLKFEQVTSAARYRKATAKRVEESFGKDIDPTSDETFVKTLVDAGLMERL